MSEKANMTVKLDNERVLVKAWRFRPGQETGWHCHEYDFVVLPQTDGRLHLVTKEGEGHRDIVAGSCYMRSAGIEHNVTNVSDHDVVILDVELKPLGASPL
ncbi:MAG: cupin domain-containing protein [Planctomycetes bacterium]|nr:cupin domain-containing protein [Planctomycetota bacterium]